jgi:hypothetical protein
MVNSEDNASSDRLAAHTAKASQAARMLVPLSVRSWSLGFAVTVPPLYDATACRTLPQSLRGLFSESRGADKQGYFGQGHLT